MIDIKRILNDRAAVEANLRQRDSDITLDSVFCLANEQKRLQSRYETLRGDIRRAGAQNCNPPTETERKRAQDLREETKRVSAQLSEVEGRLEGEMLRIPNLLGPLVPISQKKEDSVIIRDYGEKPNFDFPIVDHVTLGKNLGILDFERSAKIAGTGFPLFRGKGAILQWSLLNFMIDHSSKRGFEFMLFPLLNNTQTLTASGNLPKFADELYTCKNDDLHAIPTSEVPLTSFYRGEVIDGTKLPLRMISYSPCFRREAGAHGKTSRGLMRLHQFDKVESYSICKPEESDGELDFLLNNAEMMLKELGLHHRTARLPSCDLAQQSSHTCDIELWLPSAKIYSEVSSASNCTDYQARRANIRFKSSEGNGYVHTLNCSALATPRLMIALMESNQMSDGHITVPPALRKYTNFEFI